MAKHRLTPAFVASADADGKARALYWDDRLAGFGLQVMESGKRSYVVQYRNADRQSRRITLNGVLKADDARKQAMSILSEVAKGRDPLADRRASIAADQNTLKAVGDDYLARNKHLRSIDQRKDHLERLVYPKVGRRPIDKIKRSEITSLLDKIEDASGPVMADAVLATIRRVMNWHASRSDDFRSPIVRGMARSKPGERKRQRSLTDDEIRHVWATAEAGANPFDTMIQFILLTAVRRNEAADIKREELDGRDWLIPGSRHKSKREFLLPLSEEALAILNKVPRIGRRNGGHVFTTDGKRGIRGFSKFKKDFDSRCDASGWTIHDLRRTARSLMSRAGVDPDHAERSIGHLIPGIRGTYDVYEFKDEKRKAFEALAALVMQIVGASR